MPFCVIGQSRWINMYERILVPLDGSHTAEMALPYAEEIAAKLGDEITLVSVSDSTATYIDHLYHTYLECIMERVQRQLKDWGGKGEVKVQSEVLLGKPASEIIRYAAENNVGLIVMTSRGSSGFGPWLLGNIAAKVLRAASRSVLLIKAPAKDAALRQKRLVKRILVPLDGSRVAEVAIPVVETLAHALGAEVVLFEVLEPVVGRVGAGGVAYIIPHDKEIKKVVMAYLDSVGKQLKEKGLNTSSVVVSGFPAEQIGDYAEANAIDLIAMSSRGQSGASRWVFGNVTDKTLHTGDTAVLVVQAPKP